MTMEKPKRHSKNVRKNRPKCIVCKKFLKVFERNLCSCKKLVCMKHKQRALHECPDEKKMEDSMTKVVAPKVLKI